MLWAKSLLLMLLMLMIISCQSNLEEKVETQETIKEEISQNMNTEKIYLAGGCFWGVEAYMQKLYGVIDVKSGYANGKTENPSYEDLIYNDSGHAETVEVSFNPDQVNLEYLIAQYLRIVDPTSLNKQGNDRGTQYRTGIYYLNDVQRETAEKVLSIAEELEGVEFVIELEALEQFFDAENYHQDYLEKNPNGYCHIPLQIAEDIYIPEVLYKLNKNEDLSEQAYKVAYEAATDLPFTHEYEALEDKGIYVDIVSGEPLFSSLAKYNCGCGWASFTHPISPEVVMRREDFSHNMIRVEVRSRASDIHLGHIFDDGPKESGGKRYCINGSILRFIAFDDMDAEGYGYLKQIFDEK